MNEARNMPEDVENVSQVQVINVALRKVLNTCVVNEPGGSCD